jgi:hypothetical protein
MTLLVLDLKVPAGRTIESDQALLAALGKLALREACGAGRGRRVGNDQPVGGAAHFRRSGAVCVRGGAVPVQHLLEGFILLVQLNYVVGPWIGVLARI